jgi:hypothetical protein
MPNVATVTEFAKELVPNIKKFNKQINGSSPKNAHI